MGLFRRWSISFWPQVLLNYRRKSVAGLSIDFQLYNFTGFSFYFVYSTYKYIADNRVNATQSVFINDIAFGLHALILTSIVLIQFVVYDSSGAKKSMRIHSLILVIIWFIALILAFLCLIRVQDWYCPPVANSCNSSFTFIEYLGLSKAAISFIKYTPQAWFNYQRKSTKGWSITNIQLDFTGGILSFTQQALDAWNLDDSTLIVGNIPKLLLALESIGFDCLFLVQHYVLYPNKESLFTVDDPQESLLPVDSLTGNDAETMLQASLLDSSSSSDLLTKVPASYQSAGGTQSINVADHSETR